jgi:hypothetical protein
VEIPHMLNCCIGALIFMLDINIEGGISAHVLRNCWIGATLQQVRAADCAGPGLPGGHDVEQAAEARAAGGDARPRPQRGPAQPEGALPFGLEVEVGWAKLVLKYQHFTYGRL